MELSELAGAWAGRYRLWLEPGVLRGESPATAWLRPLLAGRYVLAEYTWADEGEPQQGLMLLGRDGTGSWQLSYVDTWHTGGAIMSGAGGAEPDVTSPYEAQGRTWGWRTAWAVGEPGELVVTSWNIAPDGEESRAAELTLSRVDEEH